MLWVFLILSYYLTFFQTLLFPFISSTFKPLVHWDLLVHWQPVNEEKEGERRNLSHTLLHSHTARALCPDSEKMREKKRKRERKRYGQSWGKKKNIEKKGEYGELPFWEYWVLPRNTYTSKKPWFQGILQFSFCYWQQYDSKKTKMLCFLRQSIF